MKHPWLLLGVLCWPTIGAGDDTLPLAGQAKAILQTNCAGCHGGGKATKGGFGFVLDRDLLVSRLLVTPGQSAQSDLFVRIQQGEMPPPSKKQRPSDAEVAILKRWIDAGAPAFTPPVQTASLSPPEVTAAVLKDLQTMEQRRRRFARYLTVSHLAFAGRSAQDLETVRKAAGKLLNSLSWHPRMHRPEPVDGSGTIVRIDLRDYKWTASLWEKLVTAYPYRLQTTGESRALAGLAGTEVVALRADWFVATAAQPPFYHDLLQLPGSDRALERILQVDVPGDVEEDNVLRSGFNDSGVSKNNRLVERHDAAYGALWRSYDFANNTGRHNLFEHPLGPNAGATSFQPAGGELIFHLPNGLQAYMLVDAKGKRIDKAPGEIVADPRRPDQRVENGISCMSCHSRGLIFKADQIRGHIEQNAQVFGKEIVNTIRATHPRKGRLKAAIDEDNDRYLKALAVFGVRDPDQEPVNLVTQRFEATLDGRTAAAELGLKLEELGPFLKQNPDQARVFGSLLVSGGTAQRSVFQENFPELTRRVLAAPDALAAKNKANVEPAFQGHTATVNCVAFSSDGTRAVSGSDDRTIRLWDVTPTEKSPTPSGKQVACLEGSAGEVHAVAFAGDGKFLLSAGRDRLVRLWDLTTRKQARIFEGHTGGVRCVAFSPDGKRAASGGDDRTVRVWEVAKGEEIAALAGHADSVTGVVWSADGTRILSGSRDGTVLWWDWARNKHLRRFDGHAGPVLCVALAPDGKSALSGGNDKTVRWWNLQDGKQLHRFEGHASAVIQVQFHPNGVEFFSSSSQHQGRDRNWRWWGLTERKEFDAQAAGDDQRFGCAAFSPDGRHVLVGGPGGFMRLSTLRPPPLVLFD
jgi:WD40 repeat protein/mono/diheme cytochrome c family protein